MVRDLKNFQGQLRAGLSRVFLCAALILTAACARDSQMPIPSGPPIPKSQASVLFYGEGDIDEINASIIQNSYKAHRALAQFYRWFQYYENPQTSLDYQLALLAPDASFESNQGTGSGVAAYRAQADAVPRNWENAHFVKQVYIDVEDDDEVTLDADIIYVNRGILKQNEIHVGHLDMRFDFKELDKTGSSSLTLISDIQVNQSDFGRAENFQSSYGVNRLKSLLHYWLSLIEEPNRKVENLYPVLSEGFRENFLGSLIGTSEGLSTWLAGADTDTIAIHYRVRNVIIELLGDNQYSLIAEMDWYALSENGDQHTGRVNHVFAVVDDPATAFATITAFREEEISPRSLRPDEKDKEPSIIEAVEL